MTAYPDPKDGDPIMDHHKKHIPESEYMNIKYMRDMSSPYPMMMPSEKQFTDYMKEHRIKKGSRIIFYDTKHGQPYFATRAYYMFRAFGHQNVSVLDGGMSKWIKEEKPTEETKNAGTEDDYNYKLDPN